MHSESIRYLIVPGWQGSPDNHWQSHWQHSLPNSACGAGRLADAAT